MATSTLDAEPVIQGIIRDFLAEAYPTAEAMRETASMGTITEALRGPVYDAARAELGKAVVGGNRRRFADEWRGLTARQLVQRFDDHPIAIIRTGQGQRQYLYDYVEYGPNPAALAGTPLKAARQITDGMYGQPAWMRALVDDLNGRDPKLPWRSVEVVHAKGSASYVLRSPALASPSPIHIRAVGGAPPPPRVDAHAIAGPG